LVSPSCSFWWRRDDHAHDFWARRINWRQRERHLQATDVAKETGPVNTIYIELERLTAAERRDLASPSSETPRDPPGQRQIRVIAIGDDTRRFEWLRVQSGIDHKEGHGASCPL